MRLLAREIRRLLQSISKSSTTLPAVDFLLKASVDRRRDDSSVTILFEQQPSRQKKFKKLVHSKLEGRFV